MIQPTQVRMMMGRALRRSCPRCGSRRIFRTFWAIKDRCPRCGLRFAREPGYFTGVYLLNLAFILVALFLLVMGYALLRANGIEPDLTTAIAVGAVVSVVLPILTYPFARTMWSAIDLAMLPLEVDEIVDARDSIVDLHEDL